MKKVYIVSFLSVILILSWCTFFRNKDKDNWNQSNGNNKWNEIVSETKITNDLDYNLKSNLNVSFDSEFGEADMILKNFNMISMKKWLIWKLWFDEFSINLVDKELSENEGITLKNLDYQLSDWDEYFYIDLDSLKELEEISYQIEDVIPENIYEILSKNKYIKFNRADIIIDNIKEITNDELVFEIIKWLFSWNPEEYFKKSWTLKKVKEKLLNKWSYKLLFEKNYDETLERDVLTFKEDLCNTIVSFSKIAYNFEWDNYSNSDMEIESCKESIKWFNDMLAGNLYLVEEWNNETIIYNWIFELEISYWEWKFNKLLVDSQLVWNIKFDNEWTKVDINPQTLGMLWIQSIIRWDFDKDNTWKITISYKDQENNVGMLAVETKKWKLSQWRLKINSKYYWNIDWNWDDEKWEITWKINNFWTFEWGYWKNKFDISADISWLWEAYLRYQKDWDKCILEWSIENIIKMSFENSKDLLKLDLVWEMEWQSLNIKHDKISKVFDLNANIGWMFEADINGKMEKDNVDLKWSASMLMWFEPQTFDISILFNNKKEDKNDKFNWSMAVNSWEMKLFSILLNGNAELLKTKDSYKLPDNYENIDLSLMEVLQLPSIGFYSSAYNRF